MYSIGTKRIQPARGCCATVKRDGENSCRTLNVLSSLICSVGGAGDRVGGGDCWDDQVEQVSQVSGDVC